MGSGGGEGAGTRSVETEGEDWTREPPPTPGARRTGWRGERERVKLTQESGFKRTGEEKALGKHGTPCSPSTWKQFLDQKSNVNIC